MIDNSNIYYKQVQLLLQLIPYLSEEECFALKGGTAINMFIRDMPRLSVDIDLMYLPIADRKSSLHHISEALETMAQTIENKMRDTKVYRLAQRADKTLSKLQIERRGVRIKIETSPVMRGTLREPIVQKQSTQK